MPTVILLDVSLSMCRQVSLSDSGEQWQIKNLANHGLNTLLDYQSQHCKLEFTSLMIFSSYWEIVRPFTRDYESIKNALVSVETFDKTKFVNGLRGVENMVMDEWGMNTHMEVILVTDGHAPVNAALMLNEAYVEENELNIEKWPLPFPFPSNLHVVCLTPSNDPSFLSSQSFFQKIVDTNNSKDKKEFDSSLPSSCAPKGQLWVPEGSSLSLKSVQQLFLKLAETNYKPFRGVLHCGMLSSPIAVFPTPDNMIQTNDFDTVKAEISSEIHICGFMEINQVASPPVLSRHLVLPLPASKEDVKKYASVLLTNPTNSSEATNNDLEDMVNSMCSDEGKQPSFCVLLHGSLKVEGMVAICQIGHPDWYGMLYSWADSKKKSNLMLSTFRCGVEAVAWLGNLKLLGTPSMNIPQTANELNRISTKKSFSQNCVVWLKQTNLQYDIQKILRHAKKLPEKSGHFYKELNRLRRAALSFGFYDLLDGLAVILERECRLLPDGAHPDAALQLTHAANCLKESRVVDSYNQSIVPLDTKFNIAK